MTEERHSHQRLNSDEAWAYADDVRRAKADTREEALAKRGAWADARLEEEAELALGSTATTTRVRQAVEASVASGRRDRLMRIADAERPVLAMAHVLHLDDGTRVTVGEVMRSPDRFEGVTCADPLEPSYGRGKAMLFPSGRRLSSWAHGLQRNYVLGTAEENTRMLADMARELMKHFNKEKNHD